jgi:ABC-type polysaccharide/polyol phosphate export permease
MRQDLRELLQYRDLLYMLAWRDIKVRYKQSVLGFLWALFMPLLIVAAGMLVRFGYSRLSGQAVGWMDSAEVAVRAVPWAFFVSSLRAATLSLMSNTPLVTKIYFPKSVLPIAATLSQLVDLGIAYLVLGLALAIAGAGAGAALLWVPLLLLLLVCLVIALGLLLSALALFFRDVKFIVEILLTFGIFFTPVFYDVEMFGSWAPYLLLNPLAPILEGLEGCIIRNESPHFGWLAYSAACALLLLGTSYRTFTRLEPSFAEYI